MVIESLRGGSGEPLLVSQGIKESYQSKVRTTRISKAGRKKVVTVKGEDEKRIE